MLSPLVACSGGDQNSSTTETTGSTAFELPALPYDINALEPHIDGRTMKIHHSKHHAGYVKKFNAALEGRSEWAGKNLSKLMSLIGPEDTALRNNGGGHFNHSMFWQSLSPIATEPKGDLLALINGTFGDLDNFKATFKKAALTRFGSGWAWLCVDGDNKAVISSTPNQDNPLMSKVVDGTSTPLLGLDVWEHAYYLKYQNRRGDYIDSFFNIINWDAVAERLKG